MHGEFRGCESEGTEDNNNNSLCIHHPLSFDKETTSNFVTQFS